VVNDSPSNATLFRAFAPSLFSPAQVKDAYLPFRQELNTR
jgi:hypothetical protein